MDEHDFEGTLVLEKLASINKLDEFLEAVDDLDSARLLMKRAQIDCDTIAIVLSRRA